MFTSYEVQFRMTSIYPDAEYNKTCLFTDVYVADNYDAVINSISNVLDDISNNYSDVLVRNYDYPGDPINVEVEYVQIVNEYGELEYLDEDKIEA
jgi:hypothetical protein